MSCCSLRLFVRNVAHIDIATSICATSRPLRGGDTSNNPAQFLRPFHSSASRNNGYEELSMDALDSIAQESKRDYTSSQEISSSQPASEGNSEAKDVGFGSMRESKGNLDGRHSAKPRKAFRQASRLEMADSAWEPQRSGEVVERATRDRRGAFGDRPQTQAKSQTSGDDWKARKRGEHWNTPGNERRSEPRGSSWKSERRPSLEDMPDRERHPEMTSEARERRSKFWETDIAAKSQGRRTDLQKISGSRSLFHAKRGDTLSEDLESTDNKSGARFEDNSASERASSSFANAESIKTKPLRSPLGKIRRYEEGIKHQDPRAPKVDDWVPPKRERWMVQKDALKAKFPEGWAPLKKLSPEAQVGIRALHAQMPELYTTAKLANDFQIAPEAIRRILRAKWQPSAAEKEDRAKRWFKRGESVWSRWAELGVKPPRQWRELGIGKGRPKGTIDPATLVARRPGQKANQEGADAEDGYGGRFL